MNRTGHQGFRQAWLLSIKGAGIMNKSLKMILIAIAVAIPCGMTISLLAFNTPFSALLTSSTTCICVAVEFLFNLFLFRKSFGKN